MSQCIWFSVFVGLFVLAVIACDRWEKEGSDWRG
jgi:hypothetical protein